MKKVGIMTLYYMTYNYGAQLQAYALQRSTEKLGYECEQICYKWQNADIEYFYSTQSGNVDQFREFAFGIHHSERVYTPETIHESNKVYDAFICGSDQIWGVRNSMPKYVVPHMALSFASEDKVKLSYGASIGGAELTTDQIPPIQYWVSELDAVSVREQSAVPCIETITQKKVASVLDPTMLLGIDEWESIAKTPSEPDSYIFVYNIGGNSQLDAAARELSQQLQCKIKTVSYNENDKAGPGEFLGLIKNAEFVLSNSFHGTVFSIIFQKQFYSFPVDNVRSAFSKNVRITDILEKMGMQSRYVEHISETDFAKMIDYSVVDKRLQEERKKSLEFLRASLLSKKDLPERVIPIGDCCCCGVCASVCPQDCITLKADRIGFQYPEIDKSKCTDCGICRERCPIVRSKHIPVNKRKAYAGINRDPEVRENSSSGGVFSAFSEFVVSKGGAVFGAMYDDRFHVIHAYAETMNEVERFRGSKYVQSDLKDTFREAENLLKQGRMVLYTGCGCQINALKAYLDTDYENLFTVDLICIGNVSPIYWQKYIEEHQKAFGNLIAINERTKKLGFVGPPGKAPISATVTHTTTSSTTTIYPPQEDLYKNTRYCYFRENCMHCEFREKHLSDISIGDIYGTVAPRFDDGYGLSVILVNSEKGNMLLENCRHSLDCDEISYDAAAKTNGRIETDVLPPLWRNYIHSITEGSCASTLNYENNLCRDEFISNMIKRDLYREIKRNSLYVKLLKYQMYGCVIDDEPYLSGKVVIYGAGKVGRIVAECSKEKAICFVDSSDRIASLSGLPVFPITSDELRAKLSAEDNVTFVITPVWDFEDIYQGIKQYYPKAAVVSIEKVVGKIWE